LGVLQQFLGALRVEGVLFTLVGLSVVWRRRRLFALGASVLTTYLILCTWHETRNGFLSTRHFTAPIILMLPSMGAGLVRMLTGPRRRPLRVAVWLVTALVLFTSADAAVRPRRDNRVTQRRALEWVAVNLEPGRGIGVRRKRDGYYADRHVIVVHVPCREDELFAAMEQRDIAWLVLKRERVAKHAPHWLTGELFETVKTIEGSQDEGGAVVILAPTRAP
jgi:hypothetical protein